ncbi:MAG: hypothetical protein H6656_10190 [Ardenticatenaceae bacterium]|nr:hypothetical protein [Ardenticatenaceae bacterium]
MTKSPNCCVCGYGGCNIAMTPIFSPTGWPGWAWRRLRQTCLRGGMGMAGAVAPGRRCWKINKMF